MGRHTIGKAVGIVAALLTSTSSVADSQMGSKVFVQSRTDNAKTLQANLQHNRLLQQTGYVVQAKSCLSAPCSSTDHVWIVLSHHDHRYTAEIQSIVDGEIVDVDLVTSTSLVALEHKIAQVVPHTHPHTGDTPSLTDAASTKAVGMLFGSAAVEKENGGLFGRRDNRRTKSEKKLSKWGSSTVPTNNQKSLHQSKLSSVELNKASSKSNSIAPKTSPSSSQKTASVSTRKLTLQADVGYETGFYGLNYYGRVAMSGDEVLDSYAWQTLTTQNSLTYSVGLNYTLGKWHVGLAGGQSTVQFEIDAHSFAVMEPSVASSPVEGAARINRYSTSLTRSVFDWSQGKGYLAVGGEATMTNFRTGGIDFGEIDFPRFEDPSVLSAGVLTKIQIGRLYMVIPVGTAVQATNVPSEDLLRGGLFDSNFESDDPYFADERPAINPIYYGLRIGFQL